MKEFIIQCPLDKLTVREAIFLDQILVNTHQKRGRHKLVGFVLSLGSPPPDERLTDIT